MPNLEVPSIDLTELTLQVRKLALIGAALRLREVPDADPEIAQLIHNQASAIAGTEIKALGDAPASAIFKAIEMTFVECSELLSNSARAGWRVTDPLLMQTQGDASRHVVRRILEFANDRPLLKAALNGRFLDVGTGTAGIALEAAKFCPALVIDGLDIWEPALALARQNVAASPYAGRIRIQNLDIRQLAGDLCYSLIWLPTMFMRRNVLEQAIHRIALACVENAYLVAGSYTIPEDPAAASFVALRTFRSGGEPISHVTLEEMLRSEGFADVESITFPLATFTLGRFRGPARSRPRVSRS
jgi:SAM-dependent methyltransferase